VQGIQAIGKQTKRQASNDIKTSRQSAEITLSQAGKALNSMYILADSISLYFVNLIPR
jgi:hypothetical protein